jgi:hypothetical protein
VYAAALTASVLKFPLQLVERPLPVRGKELEFPLEADGLRRIAPLIITGLKP